MPIQTHLGLGHILSKCNWALVIRRARSLNRSFGAVNTHVDRSVVWDEGIERLPVGGISRLQESIKYNVRKGKSDDDNRGSLDKTYTRVAVVAVDRLPVARPVNVSDGRICAQVGRAEREPIVRNDGDCRGCSGRGSSNFGGLELGRISECRHDCQGKGEEQELFDGCHGNGDCC